MIKEHCSGEWTPGLDREEQVTLFGIVSDTLDWCVHGGKGSFSFDAYEVTDALKVPTATFVTLKRCGDLRGCIGSLVPEAPMFESVHDNAVNAAMHDYRFRTVQPDELASLEVHISLLSPIVPIADLSEFTLGEHGIIVSKAGCRAVFLPEVATEQGWTKEETLSHLSMKAGLAADAWREGASFQVFSSVVLEREG
ncbi:MAG: AmmeMemoRadiSam system protein A [Kiritimatiellae bacterium]|nr:AmmeMemoRadiSam system protein A [Kiritimatiellia bacterium]